MNDDDYVKMPSNRGVVLGLKRTTLYVLHAAKKIQLVKVCRPGISRGCTLVYVPSVRAYLEALRKEQNPEQAGIDLNKSPDQQINKSTEDEV